VSRRAAPGYRTRADFANSLQFTVRTLSEREQGDSGLQHCYVA
jgi:hypothetical protein